MTDPVEDDLFWRRPSESTAAAQDSGRAEDAVSTPMYTGPPPSTPPTAHWASAPIITPPPPPRALPPQDHQALDADERQAQLVSYGIGIAAGLLALVLVLVIVLRTA